MEFEEFVDEQGNKNVILSTLTIKGVVYYLTADRKAFTKENGKYKEFNFGGDNNVLSKIMEPPKSLDIVMPQKSGKERL